MTEKESLEKLLIYQQDLQLEEECIKQIISKLNAQAHALQVEQLHILNAINKNAAPPKTETINLKKEVVDSQNRELDLSVPMYQSCEEDEDDMED